MQTRGGRSKLKPPPKSLFAPSTKRPDAWGRFSYDYYVKPHSIAENILEAFGQVTGVQQEQQPKKQQQTTKPFTGSGTNWGFHDPPSVAIDWGFKAKPSVAVFNGDIVPNAPAPRRKDDLLDSFGSLDRLAKDFDTPTFDSGKLFREKKSRSIDWGFG